MNHSTSRSGSAASSVMPQPIGAVAAAFRGEAVHGVQEGGPVPGGDAVLDQDQHRAAVMRHRLGGQRLRPVVGGHEVGLARRAASPGAAAAPTTTSPAAPASSVPGTPIASATAPQPRLPAVIAPLNTVR